MQTKLSKIVELAAAEDWQGALRIAARFQDLGDAKAAIMRAHEVSANPAFYRQLGHNPAALIAAGIEALKTRYQLATLIEGSKNMTTKLSAAEINHLVLRITGSMPARANSKAAAEARFLKIAAEAGIDGAPILAADDANAALAAIDAARAPKPAADPHAASNALIANAVANDPELAEMVRGKGRKAALAAAEAAAPADAPKADKPAKAPKEKQPGKRAAARAEAEAAAQRGELPTAPDFSTPTHKAWRKKLDAIVAMVDAGDLAGLKAETTEPKSSSRVMLCRYRDLAIMALEARAAAAKGKAA